MRRTVMKAVAILGKGKTGMVEIPKPVMGEYDCLVKVETCGFCSGTDMKFIDDEHSREVLTYPAILGHEGAGRIIDVGSKVRHFQVGDSVINPNLPWPAPDAGYIIRWGGMAEYALVKDVQAMIDDGLEPPYLPDRSGTRKIPSSISMDDAALILSVKEIFKSLRNFGFKPGMDVLVYGDGMVGFGLCLFMRRQQAGRVCCIGHHPQRLEKIKNEAQADQVVNTHETTPDAALQGQKFDLVIDAVGKPAILLEGAKRLRPGGKIALYGVLSPHDSKIDLLDLPNHVTLHIQSFPYREHDCHDEIVEMVTSGELDLKTFYSHVMPAADIDRAVAMTRDRTAYKVVLRM